MRSNSNTHSNTFRNGRPQRPDRAIRNGSDTPTDRRSPTVTSDSLRSALPDGGARSAGAPGRESDAEAVGTDDPPPGESNAPATAGDENGAAESTDEVDRPETDAGEDEVDDGDDREEEETLQVLEFVLSGDPYAVTIGEVGAIVEMKQITRFPRGPDAVDGVTDLRGEITAVLDPKRLLDVEIDDGPSTEDYIVVLDRTGDKQKVAIRVDDVIRVQRYAESDVDRNGDLDTLETDSLDAEMIDGVLHKDADGNEAVDLVPWLNIDTIVDNVD